MYTDYAQCIVWCVKFETIRRDNETKCIKISLLRIIIIDFLHN